MGFAFYHIERFVDGAKKNRTESVIGVCYSRMDRL